MSLSTIAISNEHKNLIDLSLTEEDYFAIAKNIQRMKLIPLEIRKKIIRMFQEKMNSEQQEQLNNLILDMAYDRSFCEIAEIDYSEGPPKNQFLFISSIADYLLRKTRD